MNIEYIEYIEVFLKFIVDFFLWRWLVLSLTSWIAVIAYFDNYPDNNLWGLRSPSRDYHASNNAITLPSRCNGTCVRAWKVALQSCVKGYMSEKVFHCISLCIFLFITKHIR